MVRRLFLGAVLLLASVVSSDARVPNGTLYQRTDGTYGYIVSENDAVGQWQVAFEDPQLWLELVQANRPKLDDEDLVYPGTDLNVPPRLVKLFRIAIAESDETPSPDSGVLNKSTKNAETPANADKADSGNAFPWVPLLIALTVAIVLASFLAYRRGQKQAREVSRQSNDGQNRQRREAERLTEANRVLRDPYSGPPVRENGLPTIHAAAAYFAESYRTQREGLTVADSNRLPNLVHIDRIRAVDVRGPMQVNYATRPADRDLDRWTPAWQCFLSDGTYRISLWQCANDVRAGGGMLPLPETQIRPRLDIPEWTTPIQVWPPLPAGEQTPIVVEPVAEVPETITECTSLKITGPKRYVLHTQDGRDRIVDLSILPRITLGIDDSDIFIRLRGERQVIGKLVEEANEPTTANPATDGTHAPVAL